MALLSLYAPIPKSTFLLKVSFRYAAINPKRGSSGAWGRWSEVKTVGLLPSMWPMILASLLAGLLPVVGLGEDEGDMLKDFPMQMIGHCEQHGKAWLQGPGISCLHLSIYRLSLRVFCRKGEWCQPLNALHNIKTRDFVTFVTFGCLMTDDGCYQSTHKLFSSFFMQS